MNKLHEQLHELRAINLGLSLDSYLQRYFTNPQFKAQEDMHVSQAALAEQERRRAEQAAQPRPDPEPRSLEEAQELLRGAG